MPQIDHGHYARKQLLGPSALLRWTHGSRFERAEEILRSQSGRLLDYGCGDGTLLARVGDHFEECVGLDSDRGQIAGCNKRFEGTRGVRFGVIEELESLPSDRFDVITCMEVLEHVPEPHPARILERLERILRPSGLLVISVPIEHGPSLLAKQVGRWAAGRAGMRDYREGETYRPRELLDGFLGRPLNRIVYGADEASGAIGTHGHKGFDWRRIRAAVAERFEVQDLQFTPVGRFGPTLNAQAWILARRSGRRE